MNLWNKRDLSHPPINTYKTTSRDIDLQHMSNVIEEAKSFFDDDNYFKVEYAILSRIIYRMKMKFRSSKDFKMIEMLKKAIDRFFEIKLSSSLQNFRHLIPSRYKTETYLPTKNLLDYILIRMQGMVKLLERIVESSKIAAPLLEQRLNLGHFWQIAFILFALVSRIYVLAKYSASRICEHYNKLRPFSKKLGNTGKSIVTDNLPMDLKEWLNVDWLDLDDDVQIIEETPKLPEILDFFNLVDDEEVEFCDEYFLLDSDDEENKNVNDRKLDQSDEDVELVDIINGTVQKLKDLMKNKNKGTKSGFFRGFEDEDKGEVIEIADSFMAQTSGTSIGRISLDDSVVCISEEKGNSDVPDEAENPISNDSVIVLSETDTETKKKTLKRRATSVDESINKKKKRKKRTVTDATGKASGSFRGFEVEDIGEVIEVSDNSMTQAGFTQRIETRKGRIPPDNSVLRISGENRKSDRSDDSQTIVCSESVILLSETGTKTKKKKTKVKKDVNDWKKKLREKKREKKRNMDTASSVSVEPQMMTPEPGSSKLSKKEKRLRAAAVLYDKFKRKIINSAVNKQKMNWNSAGIKMENASTTNDTASGYSKKKKKNRRQKRKRSIGSQETNTEVPAKKMKRTNIKIETEGIKTEEPSGSSHTGKRRFKKKKKNKSGATMIPKSEIKTEERSNSVHDPVLPRAAQSSCVKIKTEKP